MKRHPRLEKFYEKMRGYISIYASELTYGEKLALKISGQWEKIRLKSGVFYKRKRR